MKRRRKTPPDIAACRAVVVYDLAQASAAARMAATANQQILLLSPPGAGAYMGAGYFAALVSGARATAPGARVLGVLDCADDAGWALGALREGIDGVCFRGPKKIAMKIADIAEQQGAVLFRKRPPALDLAEAPEPDTALCDWLAPAGPRQRRAGH